MGVSCVHGPYSHPHLIRARQAGQLPQEYRPQLRPQRHRFSDYPACTLRDGTGVSTTTCASFVSWSRRHAARGRRLDDPGVVGLWRSLDALSRVMGHSSINVTMDVYGHPMPGGGGEVADRLGALVSCGSGSRTGPFDEIELADDEQAIVSLVARDGIEPPTQGFSVPCSTD
jgi:hypothetical protein